jgi:Xaa-Pro aminopeptidase
VRNEVKPEDEHATVGRLDTPLARLRRSLSEQGVTQALLSAPNTLAHLVGFEVDWENWPISDPFTAAPPLLFLRDEEATMIVPTLLRAAAATCSCDVVISPTHAFRGTPFDPAPGLAETLADLPIAAVPTAVEPGHLPLRVADLLREAGAETVPVEALLLEARRIKLPVEVEAIRHACRVADTIQAAVKSFAEPGQTEAQLAALALSAAYRQEGHRVPTVLTLNAGEGSALPSASPGERVIEAGDIILTDTSPWISGAWSDTANAVVVGEPTAAHRRLFDDLRRALAKAIAACRPGVRAGDVDQLVRESLAGYGDDAYKHHTGHGIGAFWYEPPAIVPGSGDVIEEGMVLAVEPAVYRPGWGGMRLEHVFRVGIDGNEILSGLEHTL